MFVDYGDKEHEVGSGFMEMALNYDTRDLIDGVLDPGLLLFLL